MDLNDYILRDNEKPLDRIVDDGGFAAMFRVIACVGDSLSSGEFEIPNGQGGSSYYDIFDQSWGQYMARAMGSEVYNFSRGGMTARQYIESFADESGFWNKEFAAQAYIIALGANDVSVAMSDEGSPFGDESDIARGRDAGSFVGFYTEIIRRYREISPGAHFFLVTMPVEPEHTRERTAYEDRHAELMHSIASSFGKTYVIDLRAFAPEYDSRFKRRFFLNGHMNPAGYILTAKMIMSYMDYIIRSRPDEFDHVGLIGSNIKELEL